MATYWIRADGAGDDLAAGTSYATAWATANHAIQFFITAGTTGDTFNVVNDGDHAMFNGNSGATNFTISVNRGDSWSAPGLTWRGTDSSGNAARARFVFPAGGTYGVGGYGLNIRNKAGWWIFEGLDFDRTPDTTDVTATEIIRHQDTGSGPIWFRQCRFIGTMQWGGNKKTNILSSQSPASTLGRSRITHCLISGFSQSNVVATFNQTDDQFDFSNNVMYHYGHGGEQLTTIGASDSGANTAFVCTGNTFVGVSTGGTATWNVTFTTSIFGATHRITWLTAHSNVFIHTNDQLSSTDIQDASQFPGTGPWRGSQSLVGSVGPPLNEMDYNCYITTFSGVSVPTAAEWGVYEVGWDTDGDKTTNTMHPNDTVIANTHITAATLWNPTGELNVVDDQSDQYTWLDADAGGFGYDVVIPGDFRLLTGLTASKVGGVPGALPAGVAAVTSGTVSVAPTTETADWTISGTALFSGTGTSSFSAEAGTYTITWAVATGFRLDDPSAGWSAGTLVAETTLDFPATYTDTGATLAITVNTGTAVWTISGAVSTTGTGDSTLTEQATGSTTITFGVVSGWRTPAFITSATTDAATIIFSGVYVDTGTTIEVAPSSASSTWTISGAFASAGTNTSTLLEQPTGSTTITWDNLVGMQTPAPITSASTDGSVISFTGTYINTGATVIISPSDESATWTISAAYDDTGTGSETQLNQPTGSTTITWDAIVGLTTPAPITTASTDGSQIEFVGTYTDTGATINIYPVPVYASWSLTGATTQAGAGTSALTETATGTTTIVWSVLSGWSTPANITSAVTDGSSIVFSGNYIDTGATLQIKTSISTAPWTMSGAVTTLGTGSTTLHNQDTGVTVVTWGAATGFISPASGSVAIATTDASVNIFNGVYTANPTAATLTFFMSAMTQPINAAGLSTTFNPTNSVDYSNFDFVIWTGSAEISRHVIIAVTATSSYTIFDLSGNPALNSGYSYALAPTRAAKENFFAQYPYESNIIQGALNRTNTWPAHSAVTDILLFKGAAYTTFTTAELAWGLSADTVGQSPPTNILWRKLTSDGIKSLDNDEAILEKLVLVLGMSFDKIKQYQDQMAFAHTVGYQDFDHVPKTLVRELAKLWGWTLAHDSKNNDLTTYKLATYDHYASGTSTAVNSLSAEDINYERWRRIVSSLVNIWKAKGTRKAIELVLDVYGIPSSLLLLKEYVYFLDQADNSQLYLREIPTGIFVPSGQTSTRTWIDTGGTVNTIINHAIYNARYLDIGVAESEAIMNDVHDWSTNTGATINNVNGVAIVLSSATVDNYSFENWLIQNFIPSDGSARTGTSYPILESVYTSYMQNSTNKYEFGRFEPFIDFIEENFNELTRQLVPASSRLLAQGRLYENLPFHRQKFVWIPEGDVESPLNVEKVFKIPTLSGGVPTNVSSTTVAIAFSAGYPVQYSSATNAVAFSGGLPTSISATSSAVTFSGGYNIAYATTAQTVQITSEQIAQPQETYSASPIAGYGLFELDTPTIIAYSANSGSVAFTAFSTSAVIVTNDNKFDLYLSATNMSQSGTNIIIAELFRRLSDDEITQIKSSAFTVQQTVYEGATSVFPAGAVGTYKLSSVQGLAIGDVMSATTPLAAYLNTAVKIVNIFTGSNKITTSPPIGMNNLPAGKNASYVSLLSLFNSPVISYLITALETYNIPEAIVLEVITALYSKFPPVAIRTVDDEKAFAVFMTNLATKTGIPRQTLVGVFSSFYAFTTTELVGSAIVVQFIRDNKDKFSLSTDRAFIQNTLISKLSAVTLRKVNDLFDWANPVQTTFVNQYSQGNFTRFPAVDTLVGITTSNNRSISGSVEIGGIDTLRANILQDKQEYFLRYKADAEVINTYTGETYFDTFSGRNILSSNYPRQVISDVYYYGNYFVYMSTSKEPIFDTVPSIYAASTGVTPTASVIISFNGVGDSDQIEVQFLDSGPSPVNTGLITFWEQSGVSQTVGVGKTSDAYTAITAAHWATATTIMLNVKPNADDRTVNTLQTTLDASRYYWWRVRNTKRKLTMFGYVLESITNSEPKLFFTGKYKDLISEEGTNPTTPEPPTDPGGGGGTHKPTPSLGLSP